METHATRRATTQLGSALHFHFPLGKILCAGTIKQHGLKGETESATAAA